jgi:8-oxo-dGTP pyrophosphatase MutT (NUDIX family)
MTAIRETFEETGVLLLLASNSDPEELPQQSPPGPSLSGAALDASRESIHTGRTLFRDFMKEHALSADVKALLPFTEWITPLGNSRCVRACVRACLHPSFTLTHPLTQPTNMHTNQTQPLPHAFLRRFPALSPHVRRRRAPRGRLVIVFIFLGRDTAPSANSWRRTR